MGRLQGKTAWVTGAGSGIGEAAAMGLAGEGAAVVLTGRRSEPLEDVAGRIRAALDVTDPEPLPADHPLWDIPGVIITPHVGGASAAMRPRMGKLLQRQIDLMLAGEPPVNVVLNG